MTTSTPSVDTLRHLLERLRANDTTWFREQYRSGALAWLRGPLDDADYEEMGRRIEAADLDWLRRKFAILPIFTESGLNLRDYDLIAGTTIARTVTADVTRKRGLWVIPLLLLGAIASAFALARLNRNDDSTDTAADLTVVAADATPLPIETAPATEVVIETTVPTTDVPAADLLSVARAAGSFTTFDRAVTAAGLAPTLQGAGPLTVFAPTDDAFAKLPPGVLDTLLKPENKDALTKVLSYHVLTDAIASKDIKPGPLTTAEGSTIEAAVTDGKVSVNGANVTTADVQTANGLLHAIDAVLVPPTVDIPALMGGSGDAAVDSVVAADVAATDTTLPAVTETTPATPTTLPAADVTTTTFDPATTNAAGDAVAENLTVYFANSSARLDAEARAKIDGAVAVLAAVPAGTRVDIVGHASRSGDPAQNQVLSERRGAAVLDALKVGLGAKADALTFSTAAKGDTEPVENNAKSRRVTIEIKS